MAHLMSRGATEVGMGFKKAKDNECHNVNRSMAFVMYGEGDNP